MAAGNVHDENDNFVTYQFSNKRCPEMSKPFRKS